MARALSTSPPETPSVAFFAVASTSPPVGMRRVGAVHSARLAASRVCRPGRAVRSTDQFRSVTLLVTSRTGFTPSAHSADTKVTP